MMVCPEPLDPMDPLENVALMDPMELRETEVLMAPLADQDFPDPRDIPELRETWELQE